MSKRKVVARWCDKFRVDGGAVRAERAAKRRGESQHGARVVERPRITDPLRLIDGWVLELHRDGERIEARIRERDLDELARCMKPASLFERHSFLPAAAFFIGGEKTSR